MSGWRRVYSWDQEELDYLPRHKVDSVSTAVLDMRALLDDVGYHASILRA